MEKILINTKFQLFILTIIALLYSNEAFFWCVVLWIGYGIYKFVQD